MPSRRSRRTRRGGNGLYSPSAAPNSTAKTLFTLKGNRNFRHTSPFHGKSNNSVKEIMRAAIKQGHVAEIEQMANYADAAFTTENTMPSKYFNMLEDVKKNMSKKIKVPSYMRRGGSRRKSRKSRKQSKSRKSRKSRR